MSALNSMSKSLEVNSSSIRYYQLRDCCMELNITLCLPHLEERLTHGWQLDKDNGPDGALPCFDCQQASINASA